MNNKPKTRQEEDDHLLEIRDGLQIQPIRIGGKLEEIKEINAETQEMVTAITSHNRMYNTAYVIVDGCDRRNITKTVNEMITEMESMEIKATEDGPHDHSQNYLKLRKKRW